MIARAGIVSASVTTVAGTYKDLADFGYTVETWTDALTGPPREFPLASVPGRVETVKLATAPAVKPGEFQIVGTVEAATIAAMLTNLRDLKGWALRTVAVKLLALDTTTFIECDLVGAPVTHFEPAGLTSAAKVTMTFRALKPYFQSTTLTSNALTTSLTEQPLGNIAVRPLITFTGAPSGLTLTYANSTGTTVQTLTLAALTTSGATATVIDMSAMTVVQTISSVAVDAVSKITGGDFFALDPKDADTVTPVWCKVMYALSGGSVSAVTCAYRRPYY